MREQPNGKPSSEIDYRSLAEHSSVGVILGSAGGLTLFANDAACRMFGYTCEEMITLGRNPLFAEPEATLIAFARQRDAAGSFYGILRGRRKNGELFDCEVHSVRFYGEDGTLMASTTLIDLSERIRAEREKQQLQEDYHLLLTNLDQFFLLVDRQLRITLINDNTKGKILQYLGKEVREGASILDISSPDRHGMLQELYADVFNGNERSTEIKAPQPDGTIRYFENTFRPARNGRGEIQAVIVSSRDVTDQRLAEEALKESEQRWRFALDGSRHGLWDWNVETGVTYYSATWKAMLGFRDEEVENTYEAWKVRVHPEDVDGVYRDLAKHISGETPFYENTHRMRCKDGTFKWILDRGIVVKWTEEGKPLRMIGTHTDVTEKKRHEEQYRLLFKGNPLPSWINDLETMEILEVNDAATAHYGYSQEEFLRLRLPDLHFPEMAAEVERNVANFRNQERIVIQNYRHRKKDGSEMWVNVYGTILPYYGRPARMVIIDDVTDKVKAEEELRMSNERFSFASKATADAMYDWQIDSSRLHWSEGIYTLFGYRSDEVTIKRWLDLVHPDERKAVNENLQHTLHKTKDELWKKSYRFRTADGNYRFVLEKGFIQRDGRGRAIRMIGALQDITELKQKEQELIQINERFSFASLATSDIIWDWDLQTDRILWSDNFQKTFGWPLPEDRTLPAASCFERMHPEETDRVRQGMISVQQDPSQLIWQDEFRYRRQDGSYAYVSDKGYMLRDERGRAVRMIGAMEDITEKKFSSDLLSLERTIFKLSSDPDTPFQLVVDTLLRGIEAIYPEAYTAVFRLKEDGTSDMLAAPRLDPAFISAINGAKLGPLDGSCGAAMSRKKTVIVPDTATDPLWKSFLPLAEKCGIRASWSLPIMNRAGSVMGNFAIYHRTTKSPSASQLHALERIRNILRILMENQWSLHEMRTANTRYDIVIQATHDLIWDWNLETNRIYRDPDGLENVYGIKDNSQIENMQLWLARTHPDDRAKIQKVIREILQATAQDVFEVEYRFRRDDGQYAYIYDRGKLVRDFSGRPVRVIGAAQDITERKKLEAQLLQKELERQKAINQATIDTQEQERSEIGKELHDNVNQVLTTTKLYLDLALSNPELKDELIAKSSRNVIGVINEIRQLSRSLMDPSIGDLGLFESIHDLIDSINLTRKLHVSLKADKKLEQLLSKNHQLTLFRIIQEALNNAIRHAKAEKVQITFEGTGEQLWLIIEDDGVGFDAETVRRGAGLKNIQNRVYLIDGTYAIESAPERGCKLIINFPVFKYA